MREKEIKLLGAACFLGGVVTGFLLSPIKKGICIGKDCGNVYPKNKENECIKNCDNLEQAIEENTTK